MGERPTNSLKPTPLRGSDEFRCWEFTHEAAYVTYVSNISLDCITRKEKSLQALRSLCIGHHAFAQLQHPIGGGLAEAVSAGIELQLTSPRITPPPSS